MLVYQIFDVDQWETYSSRQNLGVFENLEYALFALREDTDRLIEIFAGRSVLCVEEIVVGTYEDSKTIFRTNNTGDMNCLKRIIILRALRML